MLASGSGSNFEAIVNAARAGGELRSGGAEPTALIVDRPDAGALARAERLQVPSFIVDYRAGRSAAEERLAALLSELEPDLVVLAGFMKILPAWIVERYPLRIMNIHPALLPRHPGTHAIERTWASGDCEGGITVHYVDAGVDTGPIIASYAIPRDESRSLEEFESRIHELEHRHYPRLILARLGQLDRQRREQP